MWTNAPQFHADEPRVRRRERVAHHHGGGTGHTLGFAHRGEGALHIRDGVQAEHGEVGHHAEQPVVELAFEPMRHRLHEQQHRHREGEPGEGHHADERDEAALGARVAQPDVDG